MEDINTFIYNVIKTPLIIPMTLYGDLFEYSLAFLSGGIIEDS
jgi:hypothetical protein